MTLTKYLIKRLMSGSDAASPEVRTKVCMTAGIMGIICNLVLFVLKFLIGVAMRSIAIISDAFNNLSDTGSSVVTIIGAKLSRKKPDKEHPFGHGRYEYYGSVGHICKRGADAIVEGVDRRVVLLDRIPFVDDDD